MNFSQITNAHHCNSSHLAGVLPAMSILIAQYFLNSRLYNYLSHQPTQVVNPKQEEI